MPNDRRGVLLTAIVSLGAAALVFGFLPGAWPNPLPQGPIEDPRLVPSLAAAVDAVAAACDGGDLRAFDAAVTSAHRERLQRQLSVVEGALDQRTLRALGDQTRRIDWLAQPLLAGEVRGARAVVAVQRPADDGAQVLGFVWDGHRMRFDGSHHATGVRTVVAAKQVVEAALAEPRR